MPRCLATSMFGGRLVNPHAQAGVQVNPLAETEDGTLVAADAKLGFDDNASFRHKDLFAKRDSSQEDPRLAFALCSPQIMPEANLRDSASALFDAYNLQSSAKSTHSSSDIKIPHWLSSALMQSPALFL